MTRQQLTTPTFFLLLQITVTYQPQTINTQTLQGRNNNCEDTVYLCHAQGMLPVVFYPPTISSAIFTQTMV